MASERWLPVPLTEFSDLYEVSDLGRIRSTTKRNRWKPCVLRVSPNADGYASVQLKRDGKRRRVSIHKLVLCAFVGPRPNEYECRHLDRDRMNPVLSNLRWGTHKENVEDLVNHGSLKGENNGRAKLTKETVQEIRQLRGVLTYNELAANYGISRAQVWRVLSGAAWGEI